MKGPEVADLQDALLALLDRGTIFPNDPGSRYEYTKRIQEERTSEFFGDHTSYVVYTFQKDSGLSASGEVDSATADALNKLFSEGGPVNVNVTVIIPSQGQVVSGLVRREGDLVPMQGVPVSAFHGGGTGVRLGADVTDAEGRYTIRYEPLPENPSVDLRVVAMNEKGAPLASSPVRSAAKKWETIDLSVPVALSSSSRRIGGRVRFENGMPAESLALKLYRRNFGGTAASLLGNTNTLKGGVYSISFTPVGNPMVLEIRALSGTTETTLSKPFTLSLEETPPVVDLVAPTSIRPPDSEYKRLTADVAKFATLQSLATAQESADRQDLSYLNRMTGWDARLLALGASAQRLAGDVSIGLSTEVLYGLLRAGMPSEKSLLAQVDPGVADDAIRKVRDEGIITLDDQALAQFKGKFTAFSSAVRLSVPLPGSRSTYAEMLDASPGLSASDRTKFAEVFLDHSGGSGDLWQAALDKGLSATQVSTLKLQGKLAFLTAGSEKLTTRLQQNRTDPAELVDLNFDLAASWVNEIHDAAGVPRGDNLTPTQKQQLDALIPTAYAGATVEARRNLWAEDSARKIRLSYPTQVMARRIQRDGLFELGAARAITAQLLGAAASQGFRLGQTPVRTFFATYTGAKAGMSEADFEAAKSQVSILQRVAQITPSTDSMAVLSALGMTSAYDVMAYSENVFSDLYAAKYKALYGALPASTELHLVYQRARQVSSVTYNLFGIAKKLESELPLSGMSAPAQLRDSAKAQLVKQFPTMESLFGSMDYCECEHCRSVLSPAAYLVDLLQFLDPEPQVWANFQELWKETHGQQEYTSKYKNPYDALIARRPDLAAIPLTCENTNTALPYIDLVNEILEYYVANGALDPAAARDTGDATTPELLAEPQNIIRKAYEKVSLAKYPLALPFDLWIETARAFCEHFEVPLWRLLEIFRPTDKLFDVTRSYDRAAIFMESLGLSPAEVGLLTDPTAPDKWFEYYGFGTADDATTVLVDGSTHQRIDLNSAKALSRRLGVTYKELTALIQTAFVNPKLTELSVAYKLGVGISDVMAYLDPDNKVLFD
ncbi:Tc toxin subunit A [Vulgatibacter incomptus]|uniref:Tc toxin subunit A n=1 Tax=Vulgatibacter incomptus TaxID=1391653 RepID=UPI00147082B7|nr:Tc toxin subunit A [Vulgatibacter incomptus]